MSDKPTSERAPISTVRSGTGGATPESPAPSGAPAVSAPISPAASSPRGYTTMPTELRLFHRPDSAAPALEDIAGAAAAAEKLRGVGRNKDVLFDDVREEVPRDASELAAENRAEHLVVEMPAAAMVIASDAAKMPAAATAVESEAAKETAARRAVTTKIETPRSVAAKATVTPPATAMIATTSNDARLARRPIARGPQDRRRAGVWSVVLVVVPLLLGALVLVRVWSGHAGSGSGSSDAASMSATGSVTTSGAATSTTATPPLGATSTATPSGTSADTATPGATVQPPPSGTGAITAPRATGEPSSAAGVSPRPTSEPTVAPSVTTAPSATTLPDAAGAPAVTSSAPETKTSALPFGKRLDDEH